MNNGIKLVVYPVMDLDKAKTLYGTLLGVKPYADAPYYVGYRVGDLEIGLDPNGHKQGLTGPLSYFLVDDIRKSMQALLDSGGKLNAEVKDVGGGRLVASVKDADNNVIALMQNPVRK